ncbi:MAG: hypothetical protein FD124_3068 [Alphaproteobacteria bacterium]|nr:MAG: hypothetical protein FD160_2995 [Caulobacteraceae bacterium]TPW03302.1 MAG: hypothetical protein FD124_3068 [Alphaproteobacteria bacterium]
MNGPTLLDIMLGLLPLLAVIAAAYFIVRGAVSGPHQKAVLAEMKRQTLAWERIATALEKNNRDSPPPSASS